MESSDRSVALAGAPLLPAVAPVTSDVLWNAPRRGTTSAGALNKRSHPTRETDRLSCSRATRPSLGPEARARKSSLNSAGDTPLDSHGNGGVDTREVMRSKLASRSGKPVKAGGTGTGAGTNRASRGSPPSTAPKRRGVLGRQGRWSRPSSLRGSRALVWLPACRKCSCRSR
jgi:hypothetical protein